MTSREESTTYADFSLKASAFWYALLIVSLWGVAIELLSLTIGPYPAKSDLPRVYAIYAISVCLLLHALFFLMNEFSKQKNGRTLSQRVPRYLEYTYALLLSVSLAQVYFLSSQFSDFITAISGDKGHIVNRIVEVARKHVREDCPKGGVYFTDTYCEKLHKLAVAQEPEKYIQQVVISDTTFLKHAVGKQLVGGHGGVVEIDVPSPLAKSVNAYQALLEYSAIPSPRGDNKALGWLLFVLLPLGISLRVLKTSLELFIELS